MGNTAKVRKKVKKQKEKQERLTEEEDREQRLAELATALENAKAQVFAIQGAIGELTRQKERK